MSDRVLESADSFKNFTGTTTIAGGNINASHILVGSSTSGTIKITDGSGATVVNTMSVSAGQDYKLGCVIKGGVTITVGGTLDATLFYSV